MSTKKKFYNKEISGTLPWQGRINVEPNHQYDFSELTSGNLDGFDIVGINFHSHEGDFIWGRLHLIPIGEGKKRKIYRELKDNLSLNEIFKHFHNAEITVKGNDW